MNILVCDDDQRLCDEIVRNIGESLGEKPKELVGPNLTKVLTDFFKNIKGCLNVNAPENCRELPANPFDESIVVLDNNLTLLDVEGAPLTAESIAGYIRAFTRADYIISLNLNSDVDFDLRYLVGDYSTRADLALNTSHLANRALWTGDPADAKDGFLPWYWPRLNDAANRRRKQIAFIRDNLKEPVLATLGFDKTRTSYLTPHALGGLSPNAKPEGGQNEGEHKDGVAPEKITFTDVFITRDRSLPIRGERERLSKAVDNPVVKEIMSRTVAADIEFWFRRDVIGPQEPLVDLPHLISRLPFLLGRQAKRVEDWNSSLRTLESPFGIEEKLYKTHLVPAQYQHDLWVPNVCFWWHELKNDEKLDELFFLAEEGDWANVAFCEDKSLFVNRDANNEWPVEFPAEFEGAWSRRYVAHIGAYQYTPRSRLAL